MDMQEVRACAACLVTDVRLHSMRGGVLRAYQQLCDWTTDWTQPNIRMPQLLCWECAALVNKFNAFRLKCERAYLLLQDIYSAHNMNLEQIVKGIDRHKANLSSCLASKEVECLTFEDDQCINDNSYDQYDSESTPEKLEIEVDIKKEEDCKLEIFPPSEAPFPLDYVKVECANTATEIRERRRVNRTEERDKKSGNAESNVKRSKVSGSTKQNLRKRRIKEHGGLTKKQTHSRKKRDCSLFSTIVSLTQEEQMEEIRKRQDTAAYREAPFKCTLCFKSFMDEKTYKNHMRKHDPVSGAYQCDVCKNRFRLRHQVFSHICNVHMNKYLCKLCPYVSLSPEQATTHSKWHTGVTYKCDICNEVFSKRSTRFSHVRIKHPSQHICGLCGESFVSSRGLLMHTRLMHKEVKGTYAPAEGAAGGPYCAECRVQFTSAAAWKRHMIISPKHAHDQQFANGCRECGESFASEEALRQHTRAHSKRRRRFTRKPPPPLRDAPEQCVECSEPVASAKAYWHHFRRAHPDKQYPQSCNPFICEHCGKGFQSNTVLVYHRHIHTGKRTYQCPTCPKSFFNPTSLSQHARTHDDSRPHVCDICLKGFKQKSALDKHMLIHTGEKPFACEVCGRAFSRAGNCKLHMRTVHFKAQAARDAELPQLQ